MPMPELLMPLAAGAADAADAVLVGGAMIWHSGGVSLCAGLGPLLSIPNVMLSSLSAQTCPGLVFAP
jgi:hypothetical protein